MLLNNFYKVDELTKAENELHASIQLHPEHEIFEGHFPGQPVVPGVCMVQIVKEFMQLATEEKLIFSKGNQIKFLQLLVPNSGEAIQIHISWKKEDNSFLTIADFKKENVPVFKLSGTFSSSIS